MLRKLPSYLVLRKFSDPPRLSDLSGFTLDEEDFTQLKHCKPGHCEVQLPSEAMEEFLSTIKIHALPPGATIDVVRRERKLGRLGMSFWIDMGIAALATLCTLAAHFAEIGLWAVLYVKGFRTTTWVPHDFARGLDRRGWPAFPGRQAPDGQTLAPPAALLELSKVTDGSLSRRNYHFCINPLGLKGGLSLKIREHRQQAQRRSASHGKEPTWLEEELLFPDATDKQPTRQTRKRAEQSTQKPLAG